MTASKSLPARPSLESLRKQAKKLARDIAAGDAAAIARARAHLPNIDLPLTQRNAQLVIAREYGFAGWQDLTAEVSKRLGKGLEWAVAQAERLIHDDDVERLRQLLAEYPALLSWQADKKGRGVLGMATSAYAFDVGNAQRERDFTRACVRRAAHRRGRSRGAIGLRKHPPIARQRVAGVVSAEGPASAHARVLGGARRHRRRSHRARRERQRSGGRQRSVRARLPLRARGRCGTAAGTLHRARSRARGKSRRRCRAPGLHQVFRRNAGQPHPENRRGRENGWAVEDVRHGAGQPLGPG